MGSQSYGAGNYFKFGIFLQKTLFVQFIMYGVTVILTLLCEPLLHMVGFDPELASGIGTFVRSNLPAYLVCCVF